MSKRAKTRPAVGTPSVLTAAFYVLLLMLSFLQQPGQTTYDTRIELTEAPGTFLRGAFSLWHPDTTLGEIQNQAYGYLFPQGPFFLLGDLAGLPGWVTQRLWTALVLVVAAEGARRVARRLSLSPAAALVAAAAFALSPRLLGTAGVISAESLPGAVMPWALLPVVAALQGAVSARRAAVLSAAAVACMGGVNAVEVVGALPIVLVFIVWGMRQGLARWTLLGWWSVCVLAATLWWLLPLVMLGRYSPPFFDYVESAATTTNLVGWLEAVRGASHWVSFIVVGGDPWWPAAHEYAVTGWLVVLTTTLSALGLLGLATSKHSMRSPLLVSAAIGLVALTVAHGTWVGSPLGGVVRELLDGPLAAFRNVHKVDPVVRLPLAIGLGLLAQALARSVERRHRVAEPVAYVVTGALAVALLQPLVLGGARTDGWSKLPDEWRQAAAFLRAHPEGATWVVPGAGFAIQSWGRTMDEPLRAFPDARWVSRSQIPLAPGQSIRALDGLETVISSSSGSPDLGRVLGRMGIGHVLLRRDLDRSLAESTDPVFAERALAQSGGVRKVASFGSSLDVYAVTAGVDRVQLSALDSVTTVQGGPEDVVRAVADGVLDSGPVVLAGEDEWDASPELVTDGNQRRERAYGRVFDATGPVLAQSEPYVGDRPAPNYPGADRAEQVVARYDDARRVIASSSQGYVDVLGAVLPEVGPYSAVDDAFSSSWVSSVIENPVGQWLQVDYDRPRDVDEVVVTTKVGDPAIVPASRIRVSAGEESVTAEVNPTTGVARVNLGAVDVERLRVTVVNVTGGAEAGPVAVSDVSVDGEHIDRTLVVPLDDEQGGASYLFRTAAEPRACVPVPDGGYSCDVRRQRGAEEAAGIDRTITTARGGSWQITGQVVARSRPGTSVLFDPLGDSQVVRASTVLGLDPAAGPRSAYDGDPRTQWLSAPGDPAPRLTVTWDRPRTIRGLTMQPGDQGRRATTVTLTAAEGSRTVDLQAGSGRFPPLTARSVVVSFAGFDAGSGVAVSELDLVGVPSFQRPLHLDDPTGATCGLGPEVLVDGVRHPTRVTGTFEQLRNGDPLELTLCDDVSLSAGEHRVHVVPTDQFQATQLLLTAENAGEVGSSEPAGSVRILTWQDDERRVELSGGSEDAGRLLSVAENYNRGWTATVDGRTLPSLRVDGWKQGWVVPAGTTGEVLLAYSPQPTYFLVLVAGLGLGALMVLSALVLLAQRRVPVGVLPEQDHGPAGPVLVVGSGALAVLSGGAMLALGLLAGPRHRVMPYLGTALIVAAGWVVVLTTAPGWELTAQAGCSAGVGLLLGSAMTMRKWRRG